MVGTSSSRLPPGENKMRYKFKALRAQEGADKDAERA